MKHPSGGTVDYYDPTSATDAQAKVPGSVLTKVDVRTGLPIE